MKHEAIEPKEPQQPEWKRNYPAFRLIGGNVVSFIGDQIYLLALPLIVLVLTDSPLAMGVVALLADRMNRKRILLVCDACRGALVGGIALLFIMNQLMLWHVYSAAFIMGLLSQLYNTSQFAVLPFFVRENDLEKANAVNTGLFQTAVFLGPGLGGIIVGLYNPGYALMINSFSFFAAWSAVMSLPMPQVESKERRTSKVWADIKEGFGHVYRMKPILFTNLAMMFSIFGTTLFLTMMVFHLKGAIGLSAGSIGWLLSVGGAAAVGGAFLSPFLKKRWSYQQILFTASFIGGFSLIGFSWMSSFLGLMVMNAVGTFAASVQSPCIITIRQKLTPARLLGRVQATSRFISWVSMPAAAILAGFISEWASTSVTIFIGGTVTTLASIVYLHPSLKMGS